MIATTRRSAVRPADITAGATQSFARCEDERLRGKEAVMGIEANKALVRRLYEVLDSGDVDALDEIMSEEYIDHSPPPFPGLGSGREAVKAAFRIFWEATPGRHEIEDQIAEGDKVVTRLTAYGRHEADLPGIPRTGNELRVTATVIHRIEDGRLVEKWSDKDVLGFLQQLEVLARLGPERGAGEGSAS